MSTKMIQKLRDNSYERQVMWFNIIRNQEIERRSDRNVKIMKILIENIFLSY